MKYSTLFSFLFVAVLGFAQTSVISVKSRSGNSHQILSAKDKFGQYPVPQNLRLPNDPQLQHGQALRNDNLNKIVKIGDHCVDLIYKNDHGDPIHDTVCDFWYYEDHNYNPRSMREFHGEKVILIGFDSPAPRTGMRITTTTRSVRSSTEILFIVIVLLALGSFIVLPGLKTK